MDIASQPPPRLFADGALVAYRADLRAASDAKTSVPLRDDECEGVVRAAYFDRKAKDDAGNARPSWLYVVFWRIGYPTCCYEHELQVHQ